MLKEFRAFLLRGNVKPMQAIQARRAAGDPTEDTPAPSDEAVLLTQIRDLLAARQ